MLITDKLMEFKMTDLRGKNVLITGGAKGLGRQLAKCIVPLGARVIIWDIDDENLEKTVSEIRRDGGDVSAYHCDVSNIEEVNDNALLVKNEVGNVDVLINNAGIFIGKDLFDISEEEFFKTINVNFLANVWTTKAFLKDMIRANCGHIVNISSAAGVIGISKMTAYCASKFALFGFDESLRMEIRRNKWKIKTSVICPFFINTGLFGGVRSRFPWLIPILEEKTVAKAIVRAILKNKARLIMPRFVYTTFLLRLFPMAIFNFIVDLLGVNLSIRDEAPVKKPEVMVTEFDYETFT